MPSAGSAQTGTNYDRIRGGPPFGSASTHPPGPALA